MIRRPGKFRRPLLTARAAPNILLAGLLMISPSCQSPTGFVRQSVTRPGTAVAGTNADRDSRHPGDARADGRSAPSVHELVAAGHDPFLRQPPAGSAVEPAPEEPGSHPATAEPVVRQVSAEVPETNPFERTAAGGSSGAAAPSPAVPTHSPVLHDSEPRIPLEGLPAVPVLACPPGFPATACPPGFPVAPFGPRPFPMPEYVGDEYICDGGDRGLPVHYNGYLRMGLDHEDTIVEYIDHEGVMHLRESTRVCVYAPRFAAVRSASLSHEDFVIDRATGHHDRAALAGLDTKLILDQKVQTDEVKALLMRSRASGVEGRAADEALLQALAARQHEKLLNAFEDFQFFREGQFGLVDMAVIGLAIEAALEWSDQKRPQIIGHEKGGQVVQGWFLAQDMTGVEDRRTRGELVVTKLADRKLAHPGEVITFTIRFDNVGGRELTGIRVADNLSPRLQYIDGSVDSNLDGRLDVEPDGAGGQLLTFEFDEPLPGKTGGWLTFECRVR